MAIRDRARQRVVGKRLETCHTLTVADGARIAYRRWHAPAPAGKPPLLLVHGAASNLTRWTEFVELTRLRESHDLLRLDLRGHHQSVHRGRIGLERWADDIAAVLRQEHIAHAIIGGHCLGANVAVVFAARHSAMTAGAILVEPMLRDALTGTLRTLRRLTPLLELAIGLILLGNRFGLYRRRLDTLDLRELDRQFRAGLAHPEGSARLVKRYASPWHDLAITPASVFLRDLVEVTRRLPLERIGVPFLALLSTGRTFTDPDQTRAALSRLKNGTTRTLEAKHWIPTEQPEAMRREIEAWVEALYGATALDRPAETAASE